MSEQIGTKSTFSVGLVILLAVFVVGAGLSSYGYLHLTQNIFKLQGELTAAQSQLSLFQTNVEHAQQAAEKSESLSLKQEQILSDWQSAEKGDLNKWRVAEAQYLVKLANDHLQYSNNLATALTLLQRATEVLNESTDSGIADIKQSIESDVVKLKAIPTLDVTTLYLRLTALNSTLDQLPLPLDPVNPVLAYQVAPASSKNAEGGWWHTLVDRVIQSFNKIVIVQSHDDALSPITLPEQKTFLYQNLHAQMENAMWAVLNRNPEVYQASLTRLSAWVQQYFIQSSPKTLAALQSLEHLRSEAVKPPALRLNTTLQLFDQYYSHHEKRS